MPKVTKPSAGNLLVLVPLGWRFRYGCVWTLTVLLAQLSFTFSEILTKPMNTVSVMGNKTKLECSRNFLHQLVEWEFARAYSNSFSYIYTNRKTESVPSRYKINTDNEASRYKINTDNEARYDIVIDSVDLSHAGTYKCTVGSTSASAELIVLASDPVCQTDIRASKGFTVEGDYIDMWCEIKYNGNWEPILTQNGSKTANMRSAGTPSSSTMSSSIRVQSTSNDNGVTFTWKTSFELPSSVISTTQRPGESLATNVPSYQHLWNFKANVLYGVRNLTIKPKSVIYEVGDRLVCSADGNPRPTFQWTEIGTNRVTDGSILPVDKTMPLMHFLTFKCTATNTVAGASKEISDVATFRVTATPTGSLNTTSIALIVAGVIAVIVLLVLGLAKALIVKARPKGDSVNAGNPQDASNDVDDDYEMMDESKIQSGENIASDGYASLPDCLSATFAQQAAYDQQQLYLTLSSNEEEAT